jgi:DNA-binding response OmpR family regulator
MKNNIAHILVVDDEAHLLSVIQAYLEKEGYKVTIAESGIAGLSFFEKHGADLIILDLMLPDLSGEEICSKIRLKSHVPMIMLTAKTTESDRVAGLNLGADDYLTKPFSPRELTARVRALLRRAASQQVLAEVLHLPKSGLIIDKNSMTVIHKNKAVDLTSTEFRLLWLFAAHPGQVFSRNDLLNEVMGDAYEGYDRTMDVHIKNLRQKLDDSKHQLIVTVYGAGYKLMEGSD